MVGTLPAVAWTAGAGRRCDRGPGAGGRRVTGDSAAHHYEDGERIMARRMTATHWQEPASNPSRSPTVIPVRGLLIKPSSENAPMAIVTPGRRRPTTVW